MRFVAMLGLQLLIEFYYDSLITLISALIAILIAYDKRAPRTIVLGTLGFGLAVFATHFSPMAGTGFELQSSPAGTGPLISNAALAFGVTLAVFLPSRAYLLTGVTFTPLPGAAQPGTPAPGAEPTDRTAQPRAPASTIPHEKDGHTPFIPAEAVAAIRPAGHDTVLHAGSQKLFCQWSITEAEARIPPADFIRTHRSYLVNRHRVSGFERKKDTGLCFSDSVPAFGQVPVSRARLADLRAMLGL